MCFVYTCITATLLYKNNFCVKYIYKTDFCWLARWLVSRVEKWRTLSVMHADFVHWFQKSFFLFSFVLCKLCQENTTTFCNKSKKEENMMLNILVLFSEVVAWRGVLVCCWGVFYMALLWGRQSFKIFFWTDSLILLLDLSSLFILL